MPSTFNLSAPIRVSDEVALRRVAILALHVILFHRLAGDVTAGSLLVDDEVEVPFVADTAMCKAIKAKADEVVRVTRASHDRTSEIRVSLHRTVPTTSKEGLLAHLSRGSPRPESASHPNAWLAHAFAGGMGGAGGAHYTDCPPVTPEQQGEAPMVRRATDDAHQEAELEVWRVPLVLLDGMHRTGSKLSAMEKDAQLLGAQVRSFVSEVLAYVDAEPGLPLQLESDVKQGRPATSWRICIAGRAVTHQE